MSLISIKHMYTSLLKPDGIHGHIFLLVLLCLVIHGLAISRFWGVWFRIFYLYTFRKKDEV